MTRPRNGCSFTPGLQVTRKSGICGFASFHGLSGTSDAHGRLVVPRYIQPFAVSMPVMCIPWHVAHVRFVGLPRPTELRCIESLIQKVRNMKTSWPRAIDSRAALRALSVSLLVRGSVAHLPPSGKTDAVVLLPMTPAPPAAMFGGP